MRSGNYFFSQGPLRINANAGLLFVHVAEQGSASVAAPPPAGAPHPRATAPGAPTLVAPRHQMASFAPDLCRNCVSDAPTAHSILRIVGDLDRRPLRPRPATSASPRRILFLDIASGSWFPTPTAASSPRPSRRCYIPDPDVSTHQSERLQAGSLLVSICNPVLLHGHNFCSIGAPMGETSYPFGYSSDKAYNSLDSVAGSRGGDELTKAENSAWPLSAPSALTKAYNFLQQNAGHACWHPSSRTDGPPSLTRRLIHASAYSR